MNVHHGVKLVTLTQGLLPSVWEQRSTVFQLLIMGKFRLSALNYLDF